MLVPVPQGVDWLLSGGRTFVWKFPGGLIHVFPSWGPLCSSFFILRGVSSLIKPHILSSHVSSSGIKRLPFVAAQDSKRTRWKPGGGLKQSSRRELASLPLLSIKARQRAIPHSRGGATGSPFG